jgi:hypothetical protein
MTRPRRDADAKCRWQVPAHETSDVAEQNEAVPPHIAVSLKSSETTLTPTVKTKETWQEGRDGKVMLEWLMDGTLSATHFLDHNSKINWLKRPLRPLMQRFHVARLPPCRSRRQQVMRKQPRIIELH